jgi:hypothetical protein
MKCLNTVSGVNRCKSNDKVFEDVSSVTLARFPSMEPFLKLHDVPYIAHYKT